MKLSKFFLRAMCMATALCIAVACSSDDDDDSGSSSSSSSSSDSSSSDSSGSSTSYSTTLTLEASDITSTTAVVSVSYSGDTPYLTRFVSALPYDDVTSSVDVTDKTALAEYLASNGSAITMPYTASFSSLEPVVTYFCGAVCYNSSFSIIGLGYVTFETAEPDNAIGETGGAGSLGDITL